MKAFAFTVSLLFLMAAGKSQVTNLKIGLWSDVTTWSGNMLPTDSTDVTLTFDITIDINSSCRSLNTNGHKVTINPNISVALSGNRSVVLDGDGNPYDTIAIGNQVWMKQNLNVSHYANGDSIPQVEDSVAWLNTTSGAWCYYEHSSANGAVYGKLYNWYALNDPRGLAPEGWHVPSDSEWTVLTDFLGGAVVAGGKMKEAGGAHWMLIPVGNMGDNSSGFTGLPAGYRGDYLGMFYTLGYNAFWWTSTESTNLYGKNRYINDDNSCFSSSYIKTNGNAVRCVKN